MKKDIRKLLVMGTLLLATVSYANFRSSNGFDEGRIETTLVERNGVMSIVTSEEYNNASEYEKKLITQIDATISALGILNDSSKVGVISISKNVNNNFSNYITIANEEAGLNQEMSGKRSCKACGVVSATKCVREIAKIEDDEFDVHVKRVGSCVVLSW